MQRPEAIDFSDPDLKPGTPLWSLVKSQVHKAIIEYGFFEACFDRVPLELQTATFDVLEELFDLPLETKKRCTSTERLSGYMGMSETGPLYESMKLIDAPIEKVECFTNLLWPQGNPNFCKTVQSVSYQLTELDRVIRCMVLESFGIEKDKVDTKRYDLRLAKYTAPHTTEPKLGIVSHTDKSFVTILFQNQVDGLQAQTKDGQWATIKPSPHSFIIIMGDYFHALTNGRVHSPIHEVMIAGNQTRYSFSLFSIPEASYLIKAAEEMVDENHPLLYKPFYHEDYYSFYLNNFTAAGHKPELSLKAYCGICEPNQSIKEI